MKKLIVMTAAVALATPAFASKARVEALGDNAVVVNDIQEIFKKPSYLLKFGNWATAEMGDTGGTNPNAEGGFAMANSDSAWGFYLNKRSDTVNSFRSTLPGTTNGWDLTANDFARQNNPFTIIYAAKAGDMKWGLGLNYSKSSTKTTVTKSQEATSLVGSVETGDITAGLIFGLANNVNEEGVKKLNGKSTIDLTVEYNMDGMIVFGNYGTTGATIKNASDVTLFDGSLNKMEFGVELNSNKSNTTFFYGVKYSTQTIKDEKENLFGSANTKSRETTKLPVWVGIEAEAASWLTVRGSVSQNLNLLLGSTKTTTTTGETTEIGAADTTIGAGLAMKWNSWVLDATFKDANNNGEFDLGTKFGANASLTYNF